MESVATLVCGAIPLGYGPAAKLLVIATRLKAHGLNLVFAGRGTALDLVRGSEGLFREIHPCTGPDESVRSLIRSAGGVLSVMDRDLAGLAADCGKPLYVVDSLLWMRDRTPEAFRTARAYWAQNFIGLPEIAAEYRPRPTIVGPVVGAATPRPLAERSGLLVNLGGCHSLDPTDTVSSVYAGFVLRGLLRSALFREFAGMTTVMAGRRCIEALSRAAPDLDGIELVPLPHDRALERLSGTSLLLTSPGLTMTLESFQRGVPTLFLPPQNYSQWCILRKLRGRDLAPGALHWEDVATTPTLRDRMPESERNPVVRSVVSGLASNDDARAAFERSFEALARTDRRPLAERQQGFFRSLGPSGTDAIAGALASRFRMDRIPAPASATRA